MIDDEEDIHERVRSIVPTIDLTLQNRWDSTSEIERNIEDMQNTFQEDTFEGDIFKEEVGNNEDFDEYKEGNYNENSRENYNKNDHVTLLPYNLAANSSARAGLISKKVLLNKCLTINNAGSTTKKISETNESSLSRHSSKSSAAGRSVQRKPLNTLQNILPENDEENRLNKYKDSSEQPSNKKRKFSTGLEIEADLRIQKLEESTKQQSELHTERLRIIQKESEYWEEMKDAAKAQL